MDTWGSAVPIYEEMVQFIQRGNYSEEKKEKMIRDLKNLFATGDWDADVLHSAAMDYERKKRKKRR